MLPQHKQLCAAQRATQEWRRIAIPLSNFFLILWKAANVLQNKLTRAQYLDEVTWTTKSWLGLQKQRISVVLVTRPSQSRL